MRLFLIVSLLLGLWLSPALPPSPSRSLEGQQRAEEMAALFNKTKHKVKEKRGIRIEIHVEVRSEPVIRNSAAEYAGTYEALGAYPFRLQVGANGRIDASGSEPGPQQTRQFTLKDAKIEGALLTATKVYTNGETEKFEAVFINRTERNSQTDSGTNTFGLGVVYDPPKVSSDYSFTLNKLFYELK
jgi:hypothetical protein